MKKYLLKMGLAGTLLMILTLATTSCQNAEEPAQIVEPVPEFVEEKYEITPEVANFYNKLDSVNKKHFAASSRAGKSGQGAVTLADMAGKMAGKYIGKTVAKRITSFGGPLLRQLGEKAGESLGGLLGYKLASAVAEGVLSASTHKGVPQKQMIIVCDYQLRPSEYVDETLRAEYIWGDSIGRMHNEFMWRINQIKDQVFNADGSINELPLKNEINAFLKNNGLPVHILIPKTGRYDVADIVISIAQDITKTVLNKEKNNLPLRLMNQQINTYFTTGDISHKIVESFNNFEYKMVETVEFMTADEIVCYATSLRNTIKESDMTQDEKREHTQRALALINSALIWSQSL